MGPTSKRERFYARLNRYFLIFYFAVALFSVWQGLKTKDSYTAAQAALGIMMPPVLWLLGRLIKIKIPADSRFLFFFFCFATILLGSSLHFYSRVPYWDKIFHFLSGVLISAAGLVLYHIVSGTHRPLQKSERPVAVTFAFAVNLSVAVLWEFYEYALYVFFGVDAVNNAATGVHDTMGDMLVCALGGVLFALSAWRALGSGKSPYFIRVYRHFLLQNQYFLKNKTDGR